MGKLTKYIIVMSGLMLLFYFTGILEDTGSSTLLTLLLNPEDLPDESLNAQLLLVLGGITAVGIVIIGVVTHNIELALIGPLAIWLMSLMWDFLYVFNKIREANPVFAILFFAPILFLYGITIVEWWRGRD